MAEGLIEGLKPGSAAFYRRRFESSVMGQHMMMPPAEVALQMVHPEAPPTHPKGPNTNFQYPTPIPFRYRDEALGSINKRHEPSEAKTEHPIYASTTMEIGKLPMQPTDFPMRWYKKTASAFNLAPSAPLHASLFTPYTGTVSRACSPSSGPRPSRRRASPPVSTQPWTDPNTTTSLTRDGGATSGSPTVSAWAQSTPRVAARRGTSC